MEKRRREKRGKRESLREKDRRRMQSENMCMVWQWHPSEPRKEEFLDESGGTKK